MQAGASNTVNLTPVMNGTQFQKWEMSLNNGQPQAPKDFPKIDIPHNAPSGTVIFNIGGNPNSNIQFASTVPPPPPPVTGPIYIQAGTTKPTIGVYGDFSYTVTGGGKTLTLSDTNQHAGDYTYVLNFANATSIDPIINNGGCCTVTSGSGGGGVTSSYVWYGIGAVALIVIIVLAIRFMRRSPNE
jgi:hypothetical protein